MMHSPLRTCRGCGRPIRWVTTAATRKPMPLDADPNPAGNVIIRGHLAYIVDPSMLVEEQILRWMPHHATCPVAKEFRHADRPQ